MGAWLLETLACMAGSVAAVVLLVHVGQWLPRALRGKRRL